MRRVFRAGTLFEVPDGTMVGPVLDTGAMSLAKGVIPAGVRSLIHMHPFVAQTTVVTGGALEISMCDAPGAEVYSLALEAGDASHCPAGTAFQLIGGADAAEVLYMVTPAFVFVPGGYNDAVMLGADWNDALGAAHAAALNPTDMETAAAARRAAIAKMARSGENEGGW